MKLLSVSLTLFLALLLFACSGNDEEDIMPVIANGFTANVDGTPFTVTSEQVAGELTLESDGSYTFSVVAFNGDENGLGQAISVGFFGMDYNSLSTGSSFRNIDFTTGTGVFGFYFDTTNGSYNFSGGYLGSLFGLDEEGGNATLRIVSLDKERQLVSGEFSFEFYDEDTDQQYRITDGKFGAVNYTIEED